MAIEAPVSKFRKTNLKIYSGVLLFVAAVFAYDGYLSKYEWSGRTGFYKKNVVDNGGVPNSTMNFNRQSPPFFAGAGLALLGYLMVIKGRKIVADESALVLSAAKKIPYDSIERIDKTHFESKGFFTVGYKDEGGAEATCRLHKRSYDGLSAVLDHLVAKIS